MLVGEFSSSVNEVSLRFAAPALGTLRIAYDCLGIAALVSGGQITGVSAWAFLGYFADCGVSAASEIAKLVIAGGAIAEAGAWVWR